MKLIVITSSKSIPDEPKLLTEMFEAGLPCLHMRKPRLSTKEMQALIEAIPAVFHNRIMLHSHHELALKYKLRGIHLSRVHLSKRLRYWWIRFRLKCILDISLKAVPIQGCNRFISMKTVFTIIIFYVPFLIR